MPDSTLLETGPANVYLYEKPKGSLSTNLGGTNEDLVFTAQKGGVAGNSITIAYVVAGNNTLLSVSVAGLAITVNVATDGGGLATSTGDQVKNKINDSPGAFGLVNAVRKTGNNGTGVVAALTATALTGGSDTGVATDLGYLDDGLAVTWATEASKTTAAQKGTIALDKVVSGGSFQITIPFKQISLDNLRRALPNSFLFEGAGGLRKLEFRSRVGQSLRALALQLEIRKIIGGVESTLSKDTLIIPEASAVDGPATFPYHPVDQRVILSTWEAWPNDTTGRWAYFGDEVL